MAKVKVWTEEIHSMDNGGSLHFSVEVAGHVFSYSPWWENCGETGETFECSCGFHTVQAQGNGCWQGNHNEKHEVEIDLLHTALMLLGVHEARRQDVGYPALWDGLEQIASETLQGADKFVTEAKRFLRKQSGAPTIAQLRRMMLSGEKADGQAKVVKVECLRYPTSDGIVEITPTNPVPKEEQKATATNKYWCPECSESVTIVTRDAIDKELAIGFAFYSLYEGECPYCNSPLSLADWDDDEFSPAYNKGAEKFIVEISAEEAQVLGLGIREHNGILVSRMPLYYF
ncbi:MAG: hypothetical protein UU80_C0011G0027 [candidate division WWE3 bacterium GW2011_GWA1_41_8]|uniref:Uncharacterized protein n=4 Tax=Katanobacteria TaxID=422282 RepID=A0A0G0ZJL1_UNCKA|nr:MAG: hypothetical protein UU72_C0014G0018 [candidate division WWE3 bacterium GW2011_GWB1_41_6]KKS22221.1 MAG: hypothetical protein UU80_C0011G0027 [candidate division WWE3 bacterium GW2011_GWA1_41_8]OGC57008.1 MAG: hypothetical protein A2976_00225 [candidate division WWE3 bacterium RIFCSPLOWO2_01_FULL_41_9]